MEFDFKHLVFLSLTFAYFFPAAINTGVLGALKSAMATDTGP